MLSSKLVEANNAAWQIFGPSAASVQATSHIEDKFRIEAYKGDLHTLHSRKTGQLVGFTVEDGKGIHVFVSGLATPYEIADLKYRAQGRSPIPDATAC